MIEEYVNKIINVDCIEGMRDLPDDCIDLIVTSPPYNCGIDYDTYDDNRDWGEYIGWCREWLKGCHRILKPDGRICINVLLEMGIEDNKVRVSPSAEFYRLYQEVGIKYFASCVWIDKTRTQYTAWGSWQSASSPYIYCPYEVILIGYKDQWKKKNKGESTITKEDFMEGCFGVWDINTTTSQTTKANFPIRLPELCINLLSYRDDIVLDPFVGSGTTAIAAKKLGRKYIGFEISKNYCEIAKNHQILKSQDIDNWM